MYATASRKPWHRHKSELKKKLNLRGGKRVPRRNKTRMWGLTPVRSFLFLHFLGLTFSKPPPPTVRLVHQHAGSILLTLRVIAVRTHRRQHQNTALQLLLYHHPQARNVSCKCSIIDILITDLYAFLLCSQVLANDHSVEGHRSSEIEKSAEHAAPA